MRKIIYRLKREEAEWTAVRSSGAGGQNVNKVSTAVRLVFDIPASSLPEKLKSRLLARSDSRITQDGRLTLKGERFRTQEMNLEDVYRRLEAVVEESSVIPDFRIPTKPTRASKLRMHKTKKARSQLKASRGRIRDF